MPFRGWPFDAPGESVKTMILYGTHGEYVRLRAALLDNA